MNSKKILGVMAALLLSTIITAGSLWAQNAPSGILASPQSDATEGRYRSNADNFIRTDSWAGVDFNKFYAYTSYASTNRGTIGFATKANDIYLGAYYGGNFWSQNTAFNYTEREVTYVNGSPKKLPVYTSLPSISHSNGNHPDNRIAVILGLADINMGFLLSFASTHESFKGSEFSVNGTDFYKSHETEYGVIAPRLEWGVTKPLIEGKGIQPRIILDLNFYRDYTKTDLYVGDTSYGDAIGTSNNSFRPHLIVNPGGLHVYNKDGFRLTVDLDWELRFNVYDNEYSYVDPSSPTTLKTGKVSGINSSGTLSEDSYIRNDFTPSLAGQWSGGNLALRFKLNLPLIFADTEKQYMDEKDGSPGTLVKDGSYSASSQFQFQPNLRLAAQWKALPNKLHINAGSRLNFGNITRTTGDTSSFTQDVEDSGSSNSVTTSYGETQNNLRLGVTFLPTANLSFEVSTGVWANGNIIDVFGTGITTQSSSSGGVEVVSTNGRLFTFGSILVALKY